MISEEVKQKNEADGNALVEQANALVVMTETQAKGAVKVLDVAKAFQKAVKNVWDPVCDSANQAHKAATKARAGQIAPFVEAEKIIKELLDNFDREQQRLAREEEKRRQDEQDAKDKKLKDEQDRKLKLAAELEKEGKTEEAQDQLEDAADIQEEIETAPVTVEPVKVSGMSFTDNWKAEVIDPEKVPREFCTPSQKKLDQYAKLMEGKNAPAGVKFVNNRTSTRRG